MDKIISMLQSKDREMIDLGMAALLGRALEGEDVMKIDDMLHSDDEETVNSGITILSKNISYEELLLITDKLPHFHIFLMYNIFDFEINWQLRKKETKKQW